MERAYLPWGFGLTPGLTPETRGTTHMNDQQANASVSSCCALRAPGTVAPRGFKSRGCGMRLGTQRALAHRASQSPCAGSVLMAPPPRTSHPSSQRADLSHAGLMGWNTCWEWLLCDQSAGFIHSRTRERREPTFPLIPLPALPYAASASGRAEPRAHPARDGHDGAGLLTRAHGRAHGAAWRLPFSCSPNEQARKRRVGARGIPCVSTGSSPRSRSRSTPLAAQV